MRYVSLLLRSSLHIIGKNTRGCGIVVYLCMSMNVGAWICIWEHDIAFYRRVPIRHDQLCLGTELFDNTSHKKKIKFMDLVITRSYFFTRTNAHILAHTYMHTHITRTHTWSSGLRRLTWRCEGRGFESRHRH